MNLEHYKAASEATDADERALIPGFKMLRLKYDPHPHYGKGKFCQLCRMTRESEIHTEVLP